MKILVVDDHALVREGLRQVLKGLGGPVEVLDVAQASQAITLADLHPDLDLMLLDFHLPDMNGLQALAMLTKRHPELPVILLSGGVPDDIVQEALQQGAVAFLHKSGSSHELLAVVRSILSGDVQLSTMQANPMDRPANESSENNGEVTLTARQNQVLGLLMQGLSNKAISRELSISEETVKNHLSAIFRSLGVQNRMQAALAAKRLGYASVGEARD